MLELLPDGARFWTPYGATECLPVAAIEGRELLALRARTESGAGTCVGRPVAPNAVRIIRIDDGAIDTWHEGLCVARGEIGEITVAGPSATDSYYNRDAQTRLAKIREAPAGGGERVVHRMGDLGYFDAEGRLWFCGRMSQRVETATGPLYTEQVEPVFAAHPDVRRAALVGIGPRGRQQPVVCIELEHTRRLPSWRRRTPRPALLAGLRSLAAAHLPGCPPATFLVHPRFPVDIRHNAKIDREQLAAWAASQPAERQR
jgi:acyl-CoA synthetase (AMP-forming)/AMP-acid ligase II